MATYTSVADLDLDAIAALYGLDDLRLEGLDGGFANSSFKAVSAQGTHVVTILDNYSDESAADRLAAHTEALQQLGMPTPEVVRNVEGSRISATGGRLILVKRWIEGRVIEPLPVRLAPAAGTLLARLHRLPPSAVPDLPAGTRRLSPSQQALISEFPDRDFADWLTTGLARVALAETSLPPRAPVVCHGDVFADNLIVRPDDQLSVIDWETVSLDSALLDLGMTLLGLAKVDGRLDQGRAAEIVAGYTKERPLSVEELAALPAETEHAALIIAFHRYHRHNIRFPDPGKSRFHIELIGFVESLAGLGQLLSSAEPAETS